MYVLERRVRQCSGGRAMCRWIRYAACGRFAPLERVRKGLGGPGWRIHKIAVTGKQTGWAA